MPKNILLVDDEPEVLEIIKSRINSWGYNVIPSGTGKEAEEIFKDFEIDAVILDYLLPDTDGIELLRKIRALNKDTPVIMFTAYPDQKAMDKAEKLDIKAFIPKLSPYTNTLDSLKSTLEMIFKNKE